MAPLTPLHSSIRALHFTQKRWFLLHATPLRSQQGGAVVSHTNITERKQAEEALQHAHDFSESLINTARNIVLVLDIGGRIVRFNPYMEELTGWQLDEVKDRDWFDVLAPERERERTREEFRRATAGERVHGNINSIVTRDGQERQIEWYDAPLTSADGRLIGLICTGQDVTERQMLQREILEIAAEEQRRIGQELHDGTQQQLTGLGLLAQNVATALRKLSRADEEVRILQQAGLLERIEGLSQKATQVQKGLEQAAREVNQLSRGLIPVEVDAQGLMSSLSELTRSVNEVQHMACKFESQGPVEVADSFTAGHLYRIAQEAVNNAIKHSRGDRIEISLTELPGVVVLNVLDNGRGIDEKRHGPGMGLRIMAYRAELIGATLTISQAIGGGTEVVCTLPRQ
jgi:PAS domain S-box-containing protein